MSDDRQEAFATYFHALHDYKPYFWQERLAALAVDGVWPAAIDLPTGSGKTACIDVAVFALAWQARRPVVERTAPRRIFFCVNRRVIVDEAHQRARAIAEKLWSAAPDSVLGEVAAALRTIAGTTDRPDLPPLDVLELRGGIYRDNRWARSATQPTVICTTIDQLGSRLLFRGYGVSPNAAPVQAALIAYDSLVLLDEAHISRPFYETLKNVQGYLDPKTWAEQSIRMPPMIFVPMTATPLEELKPSDVFLKLEEDDRQNEGLARRLSANKPASLQIVKDVAKAIIDEAAKEAETKKAVGIIVNRIATARKVYDGLREKYPEAPIELVIGSMRPIDRDDQARRLAPFVGPGRQEAEATSFTVATQCLECGADYDFDVLLTECASLDALRQRFGRLNRGGRLINAHAVIFMKDKDVKPEESLDDEKPLDPVYGNAMTRTWNWLWEHASLVTPPNGELQVSPKKKTKDAADSRLIDFGINAFSELLDPHGEDGRIPKGLESPSANRHAPVMFPAYVDFWCQTSPRPAPDPEISLFIHGEVAEPDVQVCWRDDLVGAESDWCDVVALLPPTSAECMSIPVSRLRCWLKDQSEAESNDSDMLGVKEETEDDSKSRKGQGTQGSAMPSGVLWRGAKKNQSVLIKAAGRPPAGRHACDARLNARMATTGSHSGLEKA